jgi:Uma2 family endonuclease
MMTTIANDPLVDELMKVDGKAEIVNGRIEHILSTGGRPGIAALRIASSLLLYSDAQSEGTAFGDNVGFLCDLPNRKSFSPDAAFYIGPEAQTFLGFMPGVPVFAVEVRSENDYGRRAELAIQAKINDYFAAGTLVVWDVDLQNEEVVTKYTAQTLDNPQIFRRHEIADAEPAVPGWSLPVDSLLARSAR